jgi:RNA polymerase sigma factor (sigma-70 family)
MKDDATLVEQARSGDQAAFGELYERYFDRVYDFLARMVRDPSEAADLTQDTFVRAMNSLGSLNKGGSFKSWLFTIARNTALNRLERASRTQPLEGKNDAGEEQTYDVVDTDRFGDPEEAAQAAGLASLVWEAAAALEPKYRSVLMLNLREGLDSAEIAEVMGVTKNNAYVLVNRMKSALGSAVGALALFRNGRRECAELDAVIARLQVGELNPEVRRVIEAHAGSCEVCQEQRRKLASPFAIFAGFGLVAPAPGLKESILSQLQAAFSALTQQAATETSDAASTQDVFGASDRPGAGASNGSGGESTSNRRSTDAADGKACLSADEAASALTDALSDADAGGPVPEPSGGGKGRWRRRGFAVAGAGALLLLLGGIAGLVFAGNDEEPGATLAAAETPTEEPQPTSTPMPAAAETDTAAASPSSETTPAGGTGTSTAEPVETVLATGDGPQDLVPGGDGGPPQTPSPIEPGPPGPDVAAPASVTPDAGGPVGGSANNLTPPDVPSVTPVAPSVTPVPPSLSAERTSVTPVPCTYSMSAEPTLLTFARDSTRASFVLQGDGCGEPLAFTAQPAAKWIVVSPSTGSVPVGGAMTVAVSIDLATVDSDSSWIRVTSAAGAINVLVQFKGGFQQPRNEGGDGPDGSCGVNCPPLRGPGNITQ